MMKFLKVMMKNMHSIFFYCKCEESISFPKITLIGSIISKSFTKMTNDKIKIKIE